MVLIWEISQHTHSRLSREASTPIIIIFFFFHSALARLECDPRPPQSLVRVRPSFLPFVAFGLSGAYWQSGQRPVTARGKRLSIEAGIQKRNSVDTL